MTSFRIMIKLVFLSMLAASFRCSDAGADYGSNEETRQLWSCYMGAENFATATFKENLNSLLEILSDKGPKNYGFSFNTSGNSSDKVYGLVQCMGDISAKDCSNCIKDSINFARKQCSNNNDVAVWLNRCFLRYSTGNFFGQWNSSMKGLSINVSHLTDSPNVATRGLDLMLILSNNVPDSPLLFKTGSVDAGKQGMRYGLVQCNRDLNESSCNHCIQDMLDFYYTYIRNQTSHMMVTFGCRMWYDNYKFYFNATVPSMVHTSLVEDPISTNYGMHLQVSFAATFAALVSFIVTSSAF